MFSFFSKPKAAMTEATAPDLSGKVFIVTGSSGGLGKELSSILYAKNAKVYIAARSKEKANAAISEIKDTHPSSTGTLVFLHLDLNDLTTIRASADEFLAKETRLDVLWNNAGVMVPPQGSKTAQGYELQLGTNCIAPFLFTQCLYPILVKTAKIASKGSVRVVWLASSAIGHAPIPAIDLDNMDYQRDESAMVKYARSKCANVLYAVEAARRDAKSGEGIVHVSVDPGIYMTDLVRTSPWWLVLLFKIVSPSQVYGGYTELFAGQHSSITEKNNGCWVIPYGKIADCKRADLWDETLGQNFWNWTYQQIKEFL